MPDRPDALPRCAVCGAAVPARYCGDCGARRPAPDDESLGRFLRDQLHEVTSADGKLWRTVRALARPGALTTAYFDGRRDLHVRPVRLFLVLNVVLFFALGFLGENPLLGELKTQRGSLGRWTSGAVEHAVAGWGGDAAVFEAVFDQQASTLAGTLLALFIPAFAGLFRLAFGRAWGARHVVHATHTVAALLALYLGVIAVAVLVVLPLQVLGFGNALMVMNWVMTAVLLGGMTAYLARSASTVYAVSPWRAWVGSGAIATLGLVAVVTLYRVLLFWLTLWTLDLPPA